MNRIKYNNRLREPNFENKNQESNKPDRFAGLLDGDVEWKEIIMKNKYRPFDKQTNPPDYRVIKERKDIEFKFGDEILTAMELIERDPFFGHQVLKNILDRKIYRLNQSRLKAEQIFSSLDTNIDKSEVPL